MGENGIIVLFTSYGTRLATKTWKKFSKVRNETPYWSGQARSGQVKSCKGYLDLKIHVHYNIRHAKQEPPSKFQVNRAIEPRVITVDTQIASGHLSIFVIYLHIENDISKSFKGTLHGDVLPMTRAKYC